MAKDCDCEHTDAESQLLSLLVASLNSFDHEAAELATPEQSRNMLKVLKHYIRAIKGGDSVNTNLKHFLNCCAIEPEVPGSVAGGFKFAIDVLKATHKCSGKDCVAKHRLKSRRLILAQKKKVATSTVVGRNYKKTVKQPGVRVKGGIPKGKPAKSESSCTFKGRTKDPPNYFI